MTSTGRKRVVIVGCGFGGLACANELGGSDCDVVVIDRRNHNLFQPLLYQVATAALSPADIAEAIRQTLGRHRNIDVLLAEVTGIDETARTVLTDRLAPISYDYLVLATGSEYNYFGNEDWREFAPGLKSLREARAIRQRLLLAFEEAEATQDEMAQRRLLTSVIVGGGPTGVELAGAIAELGHYMVDHDYRSIARDRIRVVLLEAGPRILPPFPEELAEYAARRLRDRGVDILTGMPVEKIAADEVVAGGETIMAGTIVWAAGVKASPAAKWLGVDCDKAGRIAVGSWLEVPDRPNMFALGDTSVLEDPATGKHLPGLAQVAKQQGRWLGRSLRRQISGRDRGAPFRFKNRGNTAVIARNAAVFDFGWTQLKGRTAWFLWAIVHVLLLVSFEKRAVVAVQWCWRYLSGRRGARIIDEELPVKPQDEPDPALADEVHRFR